MCDCVIRTTSNDRNYYWGFVLDVHIFSLAYPITGGVTYLMTYTAASHQGAIEMF